jgi:hypothetical protein
VFQCFLSVPIPPFVTRHSYFALNKTRNAFRILVHGLSGRRKEMIDINFSEILYENVHLFVMHSGEALFGYLKQDFRNCA